MVPPSLRPSGRPLAASLLLTGLAWALLAPGALAQNARVVVANSSNGKILDLSFSPPGSTQLNTATNQLVSLQSVIFRDDGAAGLELLAADRGTGRVLYFNDAVGAGEVILDAAFGGSPAYPDGLSEDAAGNLFGVTSATGSSSSAIPRVWVLRRDDGCPGSSAGCLPGGYVGPVAYLDQLVNATVSIAGVPTLLEADLLEETVFVDASAGSLVAGDLLVLSSSPAMLLRYPAASVQAFVAQLAAGGTPAELTPEVFIHPPQASVPAAQRFPAEAEPNGLDFVPGGNLLISAGNGVILNYLPDGTRLSNSGGFVDFAAGLGQGKFKLATGLQDGEVRAFVADRNGGEVLRFTVEADGTGTLDGIVSDPEFPVGITTATGSVIPTPAGQSVLVATSDLLVSTIENVPTAGATSVREFVFVDPRESEVSVPANQPLHRSLFLSEISAQLPAEIEIPAYVRAHRKGDPQSGPPTFLLFLVDSTAGVFGVVSHVADEDALLGYKPDCDDPDPTLQPRLFWVPTPEESQIPESPRFINLSNDCGTSKGFTRAFSVFLSSARDTRPLAEVTQDQMDGLGLTLAAATCISKPTQKALARSYSTVERFIAKGQISKALGEIKSFETAVTTSPGAFSGCAGAEYGDLRARASAIAFSLTKQL